MSEFNFRTDLASERREIYQKVNNVEGQIDGIESEKEKINEKLKVERVKIINEKGEKAIGKPIGTYITIDTKDLKIATYTRTRRNISSGVRKYICNTR